MPDAALLGLVVDRIAAHPPPAGAADLVVAAFEGSTSVDAVLRGDREPIAKAGIPPAGSKSTSAVYLTAIEVEGFRGIGPATTLTIDPGPGLTLVVGRNGSGKSTFSEALEMLLLGTASAGRSESRSGATGGKPPPPTHAVAATFTVDGRRVPLDVARAWKDGAGLRRRRFRSTARPPPPKARLGPAPRRLSAAALAQRARACARPWTVEAVRRVRGDPRARRPHCRAAGVARCPAHREHAAQVRAMHFRRSSAAGTHRRRASGAGPFALAARQWELDVVAATGDGTAGGDEAAASQAHDLRGCRCRSRAPVATISVSRRPCLRGETARHRRGPRTRPGVIAAAGARCPRPSDGETCPVCGTEGVLTYQWRAKARAASELLAEADAVRAGSPRLPTRSGGRVTDRRRAAGASRCRGGERRCRTRHRPLGCVGTRPCRG